MDNSDVWLRTWFFLWRLLCSAKISLVIVKICYGKLCLLGNVDVWYRIMSKLENGGVLERRTLHLAEKVCFCVFVKE